MSQEITISLREECELVTDDKGEPIPFVELPADTRQSFEKLEATTSAARENAAAIGQRNDSVFRLALALAHDAQTKVDLMEQARRASIAACRRLNAGTPSGTQCAELAVEISCRHRQ